MKAKGLKEKIRNGEVVLGFEQFIPSPTVTEIAGLAGFDWVWLCIEHGTAGLGTDLENLIRAANAVDTVPIVRITDIEHSIITRCLDMGAKGLMIPRIKTRADLERAIESATYRGTRSMCPSGRAYWYGAERTPPSEVDAQIVIIAIMEDKEAFDNLDDILQVPGLDCAFFGPGDLSLSLGLNQKVRQGDKEALETIESYRKHLVTACRSRGIPTGDSAQSPEHAIRLIEEGVTVLSGLGPDTRWFYSFLKDFTTPIKQYKRRAVGVAVSKGSPVPT